MAFETHTVKFMFQCGIFKLYSKQGKTVGASKQRLLLPRLIVILFSSCIGVLGRRGVFSLALFVQGNDTTATMTSFVLLVLAIQRAEQVSFLRRVRHVKPFVLDHMSVGNNFLFPG